MTEPIEHGYDWSFAQISGADVKSNGGTFVVRYLAGAAALTPQERDNLHADGVNISLVVEQEADEAEKGFARGVQLAQIGNDEADALGMPAECVLFYADDNNDPDPAQEVDFMRGVKSVGRRPSDMYSGGNVLVALDQAGLRTYGGWMVETWYPNVGADPCMIQLANTRDPAMVGVDPSTYDTDLLYRSIPMWGPNGSTEGDWFDMATEEDLRRIVNECIDTKIGPWEQETRRFILAQLIGPHDPATENVIGAWDKGTRDIINKSIADSEARVIEAVNAKP